MAPSDKDRPDRLLARHDRFQAETAAVAERQSIERRRELKKLAAAYLGFGAAALAVCIVVLTIGAPLNVLKAMSLLAVGVIVGLIVVRSRRARTRPPAKLPEGRALVETPEQRLHRLATDERSMGHANVWSTRLQMEAHGVPEAMIVAWAAPELHRIHEAYVARVREIYPDAASLAGRWRVRPDDDGRGAPTRTNLVDAPSFRPPLL